MFCFVIIPQAIYNAQLPPIPSGQVIPTSAPNQTTLGNWTIRELLLRQLLTSTPPPTPAGVPIEKQHKCNLVKPETDYTNVSIGQFVANFMQGMVRMWYKLVFVVIRTMSTIERLLRARCNNAQRGICTEYQLDSEYISTTLHPTFSENATHTATFTSNIPRSVAPRVGL